MLSLRYGFIGHAQGDERTDARTHRESALYDLRPQVKIAFFCLQQAGKRNFSSSYSRNPVRSIKSTPVHLQSTALSQHHALALDLR